MQCEWCGEDIIEDDMEEDADSYYYHYWCLDVACGSKALDCDTQSEYGECRHRRGIDD